MMLSDYLLAGERNCCKLIILVSLSLRKICSLKYNTEEGTAGFLGLSELSRKNADLLTRSRWLEQIMMVCEKEAGKAKY